MSEDGLQVLALGVGDAFSRRFYSTTLLVLAGGRQTLIDIPDPPAKVLHEASLVSGVRCGLETVDDVIITHVHGDHANGLEAYAFHKRFFQKRMPRLWSTPEVLGPLWDGKLRAAMGRLYDADYVTTREVGLDHYFDARPLRFDAPADINGLRVEIHPGRHTLPVFGVRVEWRGRRFGYSCDTMFLQSMIDFLAPCDLIFHETNFGPHTPYAKLVSLPAELRARMRLIHYPDDFDVAGSVIGCAEQGRLYTV